MKFILVSRSLDGLVYLCASGNWTPDVTQAKVHQLGAEITMSRARRFWAQSV